MRLRYKQALALAGVVIVVAGCAPLQHARWSQAQEEAEEREGPPEGDYWALRVSYPTNEFKQSWLVESARQDAVIASAVPQGEKTYARSALSPLALNPAAFTPLGPLPLDNGSSGNGFGHVSGRANVIAVDPVDTTVAYFGSDGGGVWKTTTCCSSSTTWSIKTDIASIAASSIDDIVIDPNNHNVVYAATGDLNYGSFSFGSAGVIKSTDQGETWTVLGENVFNAFYGPSANGYPQYQSVGKVVVDPNHSNIVVAGTKTGLFLSYDAGSNWTGPCYTNAFSSGAGAQRQDTTGLLAVNNAGITTLYAAIGTRGSPTPVQPDLGKNGANGVYRATMPASGCPASWTLLNSGWPANTGNGTAGATSVGRIELAVAPSDHQTLYALVSDTTTTNGVLGVWKTVNGGSSWTAGATGSGFGGCDSAGTQMWYDSGLTVDPNNANTVFASAVDVFRSTDGGTSFTDITCGYAGGAPVPVHVDQHARAFVGTDSNKLLVGNDGGVYYTSNAAVASPTLPTFTQLNDSINTIETYAGDITANFATSANPGASSGQQDNGCSAAQWTGGAPGTKLWTATNSGDGFFTRIEPVLGQRWYYESQNAGIRRSSTGPFGTKSAAAPSFSGDRKGFITPYEIYKYGDTAVANSGCDTLSGCTHLIAGGAKVWETINGATGGTAGWIVKTGDLTKNSLVLGSDNRSLISQLAYSVTDVTKAIVGTTDGNVQYVFGLGGAAGLATVVDLTGANAVLPNRPIQDVATDPVDPLIGYAAIGGFDQNTPTTPGHLYRVVCTANCASFTWTNKSGNLPNIPVNSVIANPLLPNQVFAGTDWGLYFTNDVTATTPVWHRFDGLPRAMIWDMSIDRGFTTLAVYTRSRGVWVWPLPAAPVSQPLADIGVVVSGPASVVPGKRLTYTVTVSNNGPDAASLLNVSSPLPSGLTWAGNSGDCTTAFPCSFATLASGASRVITVNACVPANYATNPVPLAANAGSVTTDTAPNNNANALSLPLDLDVLFIDGFETCP